MGLAAASTRLIAIAALAERAYWMTLGERCPPEAEQGARFAGLQLRIDDDALQDLLRQCETERAAA